MRRCPAVVVVLLLLAWAGCDDRQLLAPAVDARAASGNGLAPAAPSNPNATAPAWNQVDVSWQDNSSAETGFEVFRSTTGPAGSFTRRAAVGSNVVAYSDVDLTASTPYCYEIRSYSVKNRQVAYSAFSAVACATTPAAPPPATPADVTARPLGSEAVDVSWFDFSTQDGFQIERSLDGGASWTVAGTTGSSGYGDFVDDGRTAEQTVCYRVIAYNASGESSASAVACATPPAAPTDLIEASVDPGTGAAHLT